ncbi:MAG: hypothetical protein A2527_00170 [Candidatus Lambdaproteobacteria bacterium RIFOXYD2_FULL_50_16]|uniref:Pentapeptide repeat protein n=1 Tax=Candidatus Lambdaproteobacteria bacterium RIFOXYD2_FULL_50_16 TaxID=1817772 RepID=A0A1F6GFP9_9PROT|nr:MAG: hypothetical protein A2527_00170 [Candidatus Lambdaproteobacteria bacterium RIFOXYD2_FULL_50_16]
MKAMLQNNNLLRGLFLTLVLGLYLGLNAESSTWEPRLRPLQKMDVKANVDRIHRLGECRYCYLKRANLHHIDLTSVDLTGADLEGAVWSDGTVCQRGSIGRCVPPKPAQPE